MTTTVEITENSVKYYTDDLLHRDNDLPAIEQASGTKFWYFKGKPHRKGDLPAVVFAGGTKEWWKNGLMHRDGNKPAVEFFNGGKMWYVNGLLHREDDLPAIEYAGGFKAWYLRGIRYYPFKWVDHVLPKEFIGQTCIISLQDVDIDSEVCKCLTCNKLVLFSALKLWLAINETCPHCRIPWNNWIKYN